MGQFKPKTAGFGKFPVDRSILYMRCISVKASQEIETHSERINEVILMKRQFSSWRSLRKSTREREVSQEYTLLLSLDPNAQASEIPSVLWPKM